MTIRSLALSLCIATGVAAAVAILSYSSSAPAAVRSEGSIERPTVSPPAADAEILLRRNGAADACRDAVWPYVPAACMRDVSAERLARPVRIIQIDALAAIK